MNRSNATHRLPNWSFDIAIRRKLRLPIITPTNKCRCGTTHDIYGDHTFQCRHISKKAAHDIIRDAWASALQPALATAGYIHHNSKIDIERKRLLTSDIGAQPFDISFNPDPQLDTSNPSCPFSTIGADITIAHSETKISSFQLSDNAISSLSAAADKHLQTFERKKFLRRDKPHSSLGHIIRGENVIQELLDTDRILLPFAINPFGRWGPITRTFLTGNDTTTIYNFPPNKPNAATMCRRATTPPCPLGILRTADANWKLNKQRLFYGNSYTAPTPSIHTIQQLGLGITKAFSLHIRNAIKNLGSSGDTNQTHLIDSID
jgi:hypothetical protein